ncbi:hypothetical protein [Acaryochloris sp. CCMEE 5410]|uniref:hypothetical protein n=1 Tax=Acaryochloris sp. CCMEE 5410 TaxID=310037 RepID=UPI0002483FC7|nr:hypothetical protein [Acaryochloris sp. CCMEE 5410]KAI9129344.1 hypothetical protein ON05_035045 [Acaryochloris sp. CCMEE 5410]
MYYSLSFPGRVISHLLQSGAILHDRQYTVGKYQDTHDSCFPWVILDWHRHGAFECQSESPDDIAMDFIDLVGSHRAFIATKKALA